MFSLRSSALSRVYSRDMGADILAYVLAVVAAAVRRTSLSMRTVQMEWPGYTVGEVIGGDAHVETT